MSGQYCRHNKAAVSAGGIDRFQEACGVVAIQGHPEAANLAYLALYALQHRGQESAGIVASENGRIRVHRGMGLVADVFTEGMLRRLVGDSAIGHVRYSTAGGSHMKNAQPFVVRYRGGTLAIAHNGNLVNAPQIRKELEEQGSIFQSTMDTEVIVHLVARSRKATLRECMVDALSRVKGSYCLVVLSDNGVLAARDPQGFRPLVLGRKGGALVVVSETCALDLIEADFVREIEPGEIITADSKGLRGFRAFQGPRRACVFELIYFARPDSVVFSRNVYETRKEMGRELAREHPVEADIVIPIPDSGVPAAIGYAQESGIPFEMGLVRNHYVGRTFIEPEQSIRHFGVKIKLNPARGFFKGKRVVVVDDSIVRGTTSRKILALLRQAGAAQLHQRICSPPTIGPCFYGIDTPTREELIAHSSSVEQICRFMGADSLGYLSVAGVRKAVGDRGNEFCMACFTNEYPVAIEGGCLADDHPQFQELSDSPAKGRTSS
jgi:amidophosphoribosyltransferase